MRARGYTYTRLLFFSLFLFRQPGHGQKFALAPFSSHDILSSKTMCRRGGENMHHKRHNKVALRQCWGTHRSAGRRPLRPCQTVLEFGAWGVATINENFLLIYKMSHSQILAAASGRSYSVCTLIFGVVYFNVFGHSQKERQAMVEQPRLESLRLLDLERLEILEYLRGERTMDPTWHLRCLTCDDRSALRPLELSG